MAWEETSYPILKNRKPDPANQGNIQGHNITNFGPETIWRQAERVNWRKNYFDKQREQKAARQINTLGLNKVPWYSGESYQSPLGTQASMRVEPEWYYQRGQEIPARMITPEIMNLYQDEESDYYYNKNRGGIASLENRPRYMSGGIRGIHPETEDEGYTYDIDNRKYHFDELLPEDPEEREMIIARLLQARKNAGEDRIMVDDLEGRLLTDNVREAMAGRNPMAFRAQGGAVGLEPGIGSLMGYAKGGMVTKMKVKKGQSKWLKKFMNNMRDN